MSEQTTVSTVERPAAEAPTVEMVAVDEICTSPYQKRKRFPEREHKQLTESVRAQGVIQPLIGRRRVKTAGADRVAIVELVAGERRWRAAKALQLPAVPVIVRELTDREAAQICLLENLQRESLTVIEEAESFEELIAMGMTPKEIRQSIGCSAAKVSRSRRLLLLDDEQRGMLEDGTLTLLSAMKLLELGDDERSQVVEQLKAQGLEKGRLPEREVIRILNADFLQPAKLAQLWEQARPEVLERLGSAEPVEWMGFGEASALWGWSSGWSVASERPGYHHLARWVQDLDQEDFEKEVPTWGELAKRFGGVRKVAMVHHYHQFRPGGGMAVAADAQEDKEAVGGFVARAVVETGPLIEAEISDCMEEELVEERGKMVPRLRMTRRSIFAKAQEPRGSEEAKEKAAQEAADRRQRDRELKAEMAALIGELLDGKLSAPKEQALAVWAFRELCRDDFFQDAFGPALLERLPDDCEFESWEKEQRKLIAEMRKPGGALNFLGALMVADCFAREVPAGVAFAQEMIKAGLVRKTKQPRLWELAG